MIATDPLIVVDEADRALGMMEKIACHRERILHRAVSGFVFSRGGRLLVQRRASAKYHCGGLIANSCCSHPRWGEEARACIQRRTFDEVGLVLQFHAFGRFRYDLAVSDELYENELVHLFWAFTDNVPTANPEEVSDLCWMTQEEIDRQMSEARDVAPWFRRYWEAGVIDQAFSLA